MMKNIKIYEKFKAKADLMAKYNLCRVYMNIESCSLIQLIERIILRKFPALSDKDRDKIRQCHGKHNAVIELPKADFKMTIDEILDEFIEKRFDNIVAEVQAGKHGYPLPFKDLVELFG